MFDVLPALLHRGYCDAQRILCMLAAQSAQSLLFLVLHGLQSWRHQLFSAWSAIMVPSTVLDFFHVLRL